MSKISEQKALEAYPTLLDNEPFISRGFVEEKNREGYIKGYDQAVQDFLEKTCEWLSRNARNYYSSYATSDKLIEDFKEVIEE